MSITWSKAEYLPPANEVCEGYVFTHVCHSVHRGGSVPLHTGIHPPGPEAGTPQKQIPPRPEAGTPRSRHPPDQTPPGADPPGPEAGTPSPGAVLTGRYWNAILFKCVSTCRSRKCSRVKNNWLTLLKSLFFYLV